MGSLVWARLALVGVAMGLSLSALPLAGGAPGGVPPSALAAPMHPTPAASSPLRSANPQAAHTAAGSGGRIGPYDGHYWNQSILARGPGVANGASVAVDSTTHVVFAASFETRLLVAFDERTSTVLATASLATSGSPQMIALDTVHHQVWVSYRGYYSGPQAPPPLGFVWAMNETTLAREANLTVPGALGFGGTTMAFDPLSQHLFLLNFSPGGIATLNTSTGVWSPYLVLHCQSSCYGEGMIAVRYGGQDLVYVATYSNSVVVVDAQLVKVVGYVNGSAPLSGASTAVAFDPTDDLLFVANWSSPSGIDVDHLGVRVGFIPYPSYVSALLYDTAANVLVVQNTSARSVEIYSPTNLTHLGTLRLPSVTYQYVEDTGTGLVVTGGYLNNSTVAFRSSPLSLLHVYPSLPGLLRATAVAPSLGAFYTYEIEPTVLRAYNDTTGQTIWATSTQSPAIGYLTWLWADNATGLLYAGSQQGYYVVLDEFSARTGTFLGNRTLAVSASYSWQSAAADAVHHLIYIFYYGPVSGIWVYSTQTNTIVSNTSLPGVLFACGMAANPVTVSVYLYECQYTTNPVGEFSAGNHTIFATHYLGSGNSIPYDSFAVNATGVAYVPTNDYTTSNGNVTALYPGQPGLDRAIPMPPSQFTRSLAIDDRLGRVYVSTAGYATAGPLRVIDEATATIVAAIPIGGTSYLLQYDPTSQVLCAPLDYENTLVLNQVVNPPGSSTGLAAVPGNGTLAVSWGAPSTPFNYPVLGYNVSVATNPAGPWGAPTVTVPSHWTVGGLTDGTQYCVDVQAFGFGGSGPTAGPVCAVPVGVPYPPTGVKVTASGTSGLTILWQAPGVTGGSPILDYRLSFAQGTGAWVQVDAGLAQSMSLSGLAPGTSFTVRVQAANAVGVGGWSAPANGTTNSASSFLLPSGAVAGVGAAIVVVGAVGVFIGWFVGRRGRTPPVPPTGAMAPPPSPPSGPAPPPPPPM